MTTWANWVLGIGLAVAISSAVATGAPGGGSPVAPNLDDAPVVVAQVQTAPSGGGSIVNLPPPRVSPYVLTATVSAGGTVFTGHVPDRAMMGRLSALPAADVSAVSLASGAASGFDNQLDVVTRIVPLLEQGRARIADATLAVEGRARSAEAYGEVVAMAAGGAVQIDFSGLRPPAVEAFVWKAERADGRTELSGFAPSAEVHAALVAAAGADAADNMAYGDGAPADFADAAIAGLNVLATLSAGELAFDGRSWSIVGKAATAAEATEAGRVFREAQLGERGMTFDVEAPGPVVAAPATPFTWSAERLPAGTLVLDGLVPNEGLRRFMVVHAGERALDQMEAGGGEPENFSMHAIAALDAVARLSEGRAAYDGGGWSLTGRAASREAADAIVAQLSGAVDVAQWTVQIATPKPAAAPGGNAPVAEAPVVEPYAWAVEKDDAGAYRLSGYVPNAGFQRYLNVRLEPVEGESLSVAGGAPEDFAANVLAALAALDILESGRAAFDGQTWSIAGVPADQQGADAAVAALDGAGTATAQWQADIAAPPASVAVVEPVPATPAAPVTEQPVQPEPAPAVEPAPVAEPAPPPAVEPPPAPAADPEPPVETAAVPTFAATRDDGAPIVFTGAVPADAARRYFSVIADGAPVDGLAVSDGFPETFTANADGGIRALGRLANGRLSFDGAGWSLDGEATTPADREAVVAAIGALPEGAGWRVDIAITPSVELCRAEVAAFSAGHQILFRSGSSQMTDESAASLPELARYLGNCPGNAVYIEGHTDSDGDDGLNLSLSVARAEAVVDGLIAAGVPASRLYAVGYGESLPIASNDTAAGKQANRRIVITVQD